MNFGQGNTQKMRRCPKSDQLPTRQGQKDEAVSEVGSTSDKARPKRCGGVRSRINFGQSNTKKMQWCPKSDQLRTRQYQKDVVVSEVEGTSDKTIPKR